MFKRLRGQMNCLQCHTPLQPRPNFIYQKSYCSYKCSAKRHKKERPELIEKLLTGKYSLTEAARPYAISRERVRQIFEEETGKHFNEDIRLPYLKEQRAIAKQKWEQTIRFICVGCKEAITNKAGFQKQKFCETCRILVVEFGRDVTKRFTCEICKRTFAPFRNAKYTGAKSRFCTHSCYMKSSTFKNLPIKGRLSKKT